MNEPVVFLPGMMADARLFGPQLADLSRDRAVMSAPLTGGERVEEIASSLLDILPKRSAIVGSGLGGMVAMEIFRRAPDRVSRIALMDTTPLPPTPQQAAERDPQIIRVRTGKLIEVIREEFSTSDLAPGPHRAEVQALVEGMAVGLGSDTYVRQVRALQRRRDQQGTLRRITVPALVMCGEGNRRYEVKRHVFMAELIRGATLHVVEGAGMLPSLEQPGVVAQALRDWLAMPLVLR